MDKTSKASQLFIYVIISLATLFHGGFFSVEYIAIAMAFIVFVVFSKKISVSKSGFVLTSVLILFYLMSSMLSGYNTGNGFTETAKPILLLAAILSGRQISKKSFMSSIVVASSLLGIIGVLSLCRILEFSDFVYLHDGVKSMQSTMQYANTTAVMLICGIFSAKALRTDIGKKFIYDTAEILLTVCLLFTHSRIAIVVYILLLFAELILIKDGISLKFILRNTGALTIYLAMQLLINKKLSFVALIVCIIAVLSLAEKVSAIKDKNIKVSRAITLAIILSTVIAMLILLHFTDTSSIMIRILYYLDGIKALIHNPLFGLSPGGWGEYQYNYQSAQYFVNQVHNGILQIGLDAGVIAMVAFTALLAISTAGLIRNKDKSIYDLYLLLITSTLILHGIFDFDFSFGSILIILGICISYGFTDVLQVNMNIAHKSVAVICAVLLTIFGTAEVMFSLGKSEFNKGNYQNASNCYSITKKLRPNDIDSDIMISLCLADSEDKTYAKEVIKQAYKKHPNNRDILQKAMDLYAGEKDFTSYIAYQNQLIACAPMQQNTYSDSIKYLDSFYQNQLIDKALYQEEKDKVVKSAIEANERMSRFNKYLYFGAEININVLK